LKKQEKAFVCRNFYSRVVPFTPTPSKVKEEKVTSQPRGQSMMASNPSKKAGQQSPGSSRRMATMTKGLEKNLSKIEKTIESRSLPKTMVKHTSTVEAKLALKGDTLMG
jgi:hypothetical protein